jgi:hypothetical protein
MKHRDCENFIPVDVFKGLCADKKLLVASDDASCENFRAAKKCGLCKRYEPKDQFTGACMGKAPAYSDMAAKTCESFEWRMSE